METTAILVQQARTGDPLAFDSLTVRHRKRATAYATALFDGNITLAEDVVQEAFVEAFRDISTLRSPEAFGSWLRRLVHKQWDRQTRSKAVRRFSYVPLEAAQMISAAPRMQPEAVEERRALRQIVRQAISLLATDQREVVLLFYIGQYSHQEIATFLGLSISTVKSRLHSARYHLKGALAAQEMTEENLPEHPEPSRNSTHQALVTAIKQQLQDAYTDYSAAFVRRDGAGMIAWYAPDYTLAWRFDPFEPWPYAKVIGELSMEMSTEWPLPRTMTFLLDRVEANTEGNEATARIWCRRTGTKRTEPFQRQDYWRRTAEGWQLYRSESLNVSKA